VYSLLEPPNGAEIDPVSGVLTWIPEVSAVGINEFFVMLTDLAGNSRTQTVTVTVLPAALAGFRVETTDLAGTPISEVTLGESFRINVYVEDLRDDPDGVFAAFLDLLYDAQLVSLNGPLTFGSQYPISDPGNTSVAGLIDEAGALAGLNPLGAGEFLLFSAPFVTLQTGEALLQADPADDLPANDILLFGLDDPVSTDEVSYGSTVLTILPAFEVNDDLFNVDEDSPATSLDVLANDQVFAGSPGSLTIVAVGTPSHGGTVEIAENGLSVWYTPLADFFGEETFTYTASDGTGTRAATVTVQVAPVNDDPIAVDDAFTVSRGAVNVPLDVLANDSIGPDVGETLTVIAFGNLSAGGLLAIPAEGDRLLYTPASNFVGVETFTYTISDGQGGTAQATVTVTVTAEGLPPAARDDLFTVLEDSVENVLDVLGNDLNQNDPGAELTIVNVTTPEHGGSVTIAEDGLSLIYSPQTDFFGSERFVYTIQDQQGLTAQATVTVVVQAVNDPPTANDDTFTLVKDTSNNVLDVLANDSSDPDGPEVLTIVAVGTTAAGGVVEIAADGLSLRYTPPAGFTGTDTFTYTIQDPGQLTAQATVTVTVQEYTPGSVSGFAYLDVNNNGVKETTESGVGGVTITLRGTDLYGNNVEQTQTTDARGYYQFSSLAPGTYRVIQTQPEMLLDGIDSGGSFATVVGNDQLQIQLPDNTHATDLNFGERGRQAQYISVIDFFASTPRDSVLVAASDDGNDQWYAIEGGWSHAQSIHVQVTPNAPSAMFQVTSIDATDFTATLALDVPSQVQPLGNSGQHQLIRVVAEPASLFPEAGCFCAAGETAATALQAAGLGAGDAEGESGGMRPLIMSSLQSPSYHPIDAALVAESPAPSPLMAPTPADAYQAADLLMAEQASPDADFWFDDSSWTDPDDQSNPDPELIDDVLVRLLDFDPNQLVWLVKEMVG
jgi:large repetitive protein